MPQATLRARMGAIAVTTVLTTFGLFATTLSVGTASASSSNPISAPTTTPPTTTAPTAAATPDVMSISAPTVSHPHKARARISVRKRMMRVHNIKVQKVLREASRQKGKPYVYGADGPGAFDCSGLVRFVFMRSVRRVLPHNAAAQYYATRHISRKRLRPGDLVFVDDGGYISHVGIFAGHHHWWVAPHTGTRVQLQRIYHAHFLYGRVLTLGPKGHRHKK